MKAAYSNTAGSKLIAAYALGYVLAIAALISDIRLGGVHFTVVGLAGTLVLSVLVIHRMARAMVLGPTPVRLEPAPVGVPSVQRRAAA